MIKHEHFQIGIWILAFMFGWSFWNGYCRPSRKVNIFEIVAVLTAILIGAILILPL